MVIAIDGYEANQAVRVGIGRYAYEILIHMYELLRDRYIKGELSDVYRVYLPNLPLPDMPKASPWWQYRVVGPKTLWTFFGLPRALRKEVPVADVVFSPTHYIPRFITTPRVMSVMDLSYLQFPELFKRQDLHKLTRWTQYAASHAAAVLTISEFSKNAIIDTYHVPGSSVYVTYPGLSALNSMGTNAKYTIAKHYILSVGTIQPRKNYTRLIEAFSEFLKLNKQKFGVIDLVIVGKKGWLYEEILKAPVKYGVKDRVKFLDFVPDGDLPALYKNALCFALPSLYEGFGLPVLEAMAEGCPVVVSSTSSLPEIAGKAGIYVTPEDTKSITQGLLTAVRQRNLIQGRTRIKKGLEQVKKFTWEEAAKQTIEVLEKVARKGVKS